MTITRSDTEIIRDRLDPLDRAVERRTSRQIRHARPFARMTASLRRLVDAATPRTDAEISRALFAIVAPPCAFAVGFMLPFGIL